MIDLDTAALDKVLQALGRGSPATATRPAIFDDENLQQALDVLPLVRRARAGVAGTGGLGAIQLTNAHAGAGTVTSFVNVYNLGAGGAQNSFPEDMRYFDVWAYGFRARTTAGVGGLFTAGRVQAGPIPAVQAGITGISVELGNFNAETTLGATTYLTWSEAAGVIADPARPWPQAMRLPRGANLSWQTIATGVSTYVLDVYVACFPAGTGQDALGAT